MISPRKVPGTAGQPTEGLSSITGDAGLPRRGVPRKADLAPRPCWNPYCVLGRPVTNTRIGSWRGAGECHLAVLFLYLCILVSCKW